MHYNSFLTSFYERSNGCIKWAYFARKIGLVLLCGMLTTAGCSTATRETADSPSDIDSVTLMLNWYPEAEHGGYYAAQVHGIFKKYNLDVTIREGGPNAPVAQEMVTGRVEFGVGNADDVLLFREQDAQVKSLLAPIQDTPRCILVRESADVTSLEDLNGMLLQANEGRAFVDFLESQGLLDGVQVVPYSGTVAKLVTEENVAIQAYSFSEPLMAQQEGVATRALMLSEAGFNPYASCLLATDEYIEGHPDIVQRMVAACREGWQKYLESPAETNAAILAANSHGMTAEALEFGVRQLRPLCLPAKMPSSDVGKMDRQRWETLVQQFVELQLVSPDKVTADAVFTSDFWPAEQPTQAVE